MRSGYWLVAVRGTTHCSRGTVGILPPEEETGVALGFGMGWSVDGLQARLCSHGLHVELGCV